MNTNHRIFEDTLNNLEQCKILLEEAGSAKDYITDETTSYEERAVYNLIKTCKKIADQWGISDEAL